MWEPIIDTLPTLHQPSHSKVSNYLNDQRRTGQFCDVIIELRNTEHFVFAHYCVVGAQSRYIGGPHLAQKSLQFSMHNPLKIVINDFDCLECLHSIVDFFYEDVMSIAKDHETHFRKLAQLLAVTELISLFQNYDNPSGTLFNSTILNISDNNEDTPLGSKEGEDGIFMATDKIFKDQRTYFKLRNPNNVISANNKMNHCMACDFKCYNVHDMISHMYSCEPSHLTCSLCEVGFIGWREYDAHLRNHTSDLKKPFFCIECGARFATRASLLVHTPKHSTETPHQCPHCNKSFKWKHGLRGHLLTHNEEKQMLCDVCGFSTKYLKALKSHKLLHTGEYFKCPFPNCTHSANRKENLKLHIETHKQERPFVCEVCGCKFSQNKNLKRHAIKHLSTDINKYKCELCSFGSHRSDKVKEHTQRVHTEKAVMLELPEVVENSFENQADDSFQLMNLTLFPNQTQTKKPNKQTEPKKKDVQETKISLPERSIVPKLMMDDLMVIPSTLLDEDIFEM